MKTKTPKDDFEKRVELHSQVSIKAYDDGLLLGKLLGKKEEQERILKIIDDDIRLFKSFKESRNIMGVGELKELRISDFKFLKERIKGDEA